MRKGCAQMKGKESKRERDADEEEREMREEEGQGEETTLRSALFASRDLRAGEEVVLGWEWDDGHAVHRVLALLRAPNMFHPIPPLHGDRNNSKAELRHLKNQLSNILHPLSSTFTTCACCARARDCALNAMAAVVERLDGPVSSFEFPTERDGGAWRAWRHDEGHQERNGTGFGSWGNVDLGPLVGAKRGFRARERVPYSGGMGGMEMVDEEDSAEGEGRRVKSVLKKKVGGRRVVAGKHAKEAEERERAREKEKEAFTFEVVPPEGAQAPYVRQDRKGKGKAQALDCDEDVEMDVDCVGGRSKDVSRDDNTTDCSESASRFASLLVPTSHTQPILEPRPPDPPPSSTSYTLTPEDEDRMPPKMRKRWMHREVQTRSRQEEPLFGKERSRRFGQIDTVDKGDKPEKVFDGRLVDAQRGLGIRFDDKPAHAPATPDDLNRDNQLMPPPPLPAALDPTTISSQRARSWTPTPSPPSPNLPTPSPTQPGLSPVVEPRIAHPNGHLRTLLSGLDAGGMGISPLTGFANLSLLSPALSLDKEDNSKSVEVSIKVSSPASSPPPPSPVHEVVVEKEIEEQPEDKPQEVSHPEEGASAALVDEDVEMRDVDEEEVTESVEAEVPEEGTNEKEARGLSSTWSPLRRASKLPTDVDEPTPEKQTDTVPAVVVRDEEVPSEPAQTKATPSPLDSMASTPASRRSPVPVTCFDDISLLEDMPREPEVVRSKAKVDVQQTSVPETISPPSLIISSIPLSRSSQPPEPTNVEAPTSTSKSAIPITLAPAKTLPPDHFFDTDDEEEWKRQVEIDVDVSADIRDSPSPHPETPPAPVPRFESKKVEVEEIEEDGDDGEETPKRPSVAPRTRTPRILSSGSEREEEVGSPASHVLAFRERERKDSVDSSGSASPAPVEDEEDQQAMDVEMEEMHEPPPPSGSTVAESEAPPPSATSVAAESMEVVERPIEDRQSSPVPAPVPTPSPALDVPVSSAPPSIAPKS